MTKAKWHSGPPPSLGWWPAMLYRDVNSLRWWNGKWWSLHATAEYNEFDARHIAQYKESKTALIRWQHRPKSWPERSRT